MAGLRISGLASGMDVDKIVSDMMKAERIPLDKLHQNKTYTEWQRDDYRTMNTALSELDTLIFEGIGMQSSFNKKTVTVSNPDVLSVKNVNATSDFSGTINKVTQLASAATMISNGAMTVPADLDATKKITELKMSELGVTSQTISITTINKDGGFDVKPYTLELKADNTLESVINEINANSGVTVFFDEKLKQFSIQAKNTGVPKLGAAITLDATSGGVSVSAEDNFFKKVMNISAPNSGTVDATGKAVEVTAGNSSGQNAKLTYNGLEIGRSSNTFAINGANLTVKKTTADAVTYSSTPDVDSIYDSIKKFVDSYNGLIANISDKTSEKKNNDYPPLTDAQKEALSEDEIKKWETLAKKGTLRRDSTLSSLLTKMRSSIYTSVSNTSFGNLSKIGISTTSNYLEGGKLKIDEEKLRAAIEEDPNGIYNLFNANGEKTVDGKTTTNFSENGIARRLRVDLKTAMTDISTKAGKSSSVNNTFTLGKLLNNYEDKISAFEEKMKSLESRYYKQFTAMEKAINKANSQSASIASYFPS